jgi:hypothetical protein
MNILKFDKVEKMSEHIGIPPGGSSWNDQYRSIHKQRENPARQRADFETLSKVFLH